MTLSTACQLLSLVQLQVCEPLKEHNHVFCAREWFWFSDRLTQIQTCENYHRAFIKFNLFASSSINFSFALKLLILHPRVDLYLLVVYKISNKISTITLHIRIFNWSACSGMDLPCPCSCITHVAFGMLCHNIGPYSFYLPFTNLKWVTLPE